MPDEQLDENEDQDHSSLSSNELTSDWHATWGHDNSPMMNVVPGLVAREITRKPANRASSAVGCSQGLGYGGRAEQKPTPLCRVKCDVGRVANDRQQMQFRTTDHLITKRQVGQHRPQCCRIQAHLQIPPW